MGRRGEKGEARLSTFLWLAVFAAAGWAGWNVLPCYIANYMLVDKMNELARAPQYSHPDEKILDLLMKECRERGLDGYVRRTSFKIGTRDTGRTISMEYEREVEILPGWKHRFRFKGFVDQPIV